MKRAIRPLRMSDLPAVPDVFDRLMGESLLPRSFWGEETLRGIPVDMYEEEDFYLRENRYGRVERRLLLPHDVDADGAVAEFEDGVLMLTLPILDGDARHEIAIQGKESAVSGRGVGSGPRPVAFGGPCPLARCVRRRPASCPRCVP